MPIPKPEQGEKQYKYVSRCLEVTTKEFPRAQAIAICLGNWRNRNKS